jgi:hypothetical protein
MAADSQGPGRCLQTFSVIRLGLDALRAEGQINALHVTDFTPVAA